MASKVDLSQIKQAFQEALSEYGVHLQLAWRETKLHVLIEFAPDTHLNQSALLSAVQTFLKSTSLGSIQQVVVYGRSVGQSVPDWHKSFQISHPGEITENTAVSFIGQPPELGRVSSPTTQPPTDTTSDAFRAEKTLSIDEILSKLDRPALDIPMQGELSESVDGSLPNLFDDLASIRRKRSSHPQLNERAWKHEAGKENQPDQGDGEEEGDFDSQPSSEDSADLTNRSFNFRPGELGIILTLGSVLLCNSVAQKISEIAAITNFLSDVGVPQILLVWIVDGFLLILTTGLQSLLVDRFDRITLIRSVSIIMAAATVLLRIMLDFGAPGWMSYSFLYLVSQQQYTFFPLIFWILASDIFDMSQTKRAFPRIAVFGLIGQLVGIIISAIAPDFLSQIGLNLPELLTFNILIYMVIYLIIQFGLRTARIRSTVQRIDSIGETLSEGWSFVKEVPAFGFLTLTILAVLICDNVIEFQFYVASESTFQNLSSYQVFFSLFTLARILSYVLIQTFLTEKIIASVGLKNTLSITPFSALAGSVCALASPGLGGSVLSVILQKLPFYSIDETARKSFQGLVPEERRGRVSIFMDSYLVAGGNIIGSLTMILMLFLGSWFGHESGLPYTYLAIGLLASLLAIWSVMQMRKVYDSSMFNWRLKRRQRGKSVLDKLDF